jgi:hypothetical protein
MRIDYREIASAASTAQAWCRSSDRAVSALSLSRSRGLPSTISIISPRLIARMVTCVMATALDGSRSGE